MDSCVQLSDPTFQDIQFLNCDAGGTAPITVRFCAIRWKLDESSIYINECTDFLDRKALVLVPQSTPGNWVLHARRIYVVYGRAAESYPSPKDSSVKRSTLEDGASRIASKFKWDGETVDSSYVSGYQACLQIEETSELSKINLSEFEHQTVTQLLDDYNGNVVFELPPATLADLAKKDARLGTTDAFEKAFDFAIRRTAPLANIPHIISGDINTTSRKRKGLATSTIHPTDTHRHDRVAVTTQVKRTVRGKLSFDFEPPEHAVPELGESSRPPVSAVTAVTTLSSSTDDSAEPDRQNDVTDSQPVQRNLEVPVYTFITSLSSDDEPAEDPLQQGHPHFPVPEPEIAGPAEPVKQYFPIPAEPEFEAPKAPFFEVPADPEMAGPEPNIADPDEPEVVVLGVTPRRRPNTRVSMTRQREHINEVMQHGQAIEEQIVDKRFWHLSRINRGGHPSCNAVMVGRNAPRAFCKTRIKSSGLSMHGMPVVAPSFVGYTKFNGIER
ncbi:hypothetical protein R1sor_015291 [Riccia sorocarpa]|uniref:Uncharacterized protein n=1 Tax=Riccia sorocarpa TaxID=122646 RepID=A0ABD3HBV6_9MARC